MKFRKERIPLSGATNLDYRVKLKNCIIDTRFSFDQGKDIKKITDF